MATRSVRFEFHCERTLTFRHDVPKRLIGADSATDAGYRDLYISAMGNIVREHTDECIAASQKECSVCGSAETSQVLTTPMSYLHLPSDPFVAVLVTPVCDKAACNKQGQLNVNVMLQEITGMHEGEVQEGGGGIPKATASISRNAHCPCGSSRKYKKCCGKGEGSDE